MGKRSIVRRLAFKQFWAILIIIILVLSGCGTKTTDSNNLTVSPQDPSPITLSKDEYLKTIASYSDAAKQDLDILRAIPSLLNKALLYDGLYFDESQRQILANLAAVRNDAQQRQQQLKNSFITPDGFSTLTQQGIKAFELLESYSTSKMSIIGSLTKASRLDDSHRAVADGIGDVALTTQTFTNNVKLALYGQPILPTTQPTVPEQPQLSTNQTSPIAPVSTPQPNTPSNPQPPPNEQQSGQQQQKRTFEIKYYVDSQGNVISNFPNGSNIQLALGDTIRFTMTKDGPSARVMVSTRCLGSPSGDSNYVQYEAESLGNGDVTIVPQYDWNKAFEYHVFVNYAITDSPYD